MATSTNQYNPGYAVPPGWILEEQLEVQDVSHAELARHCGLSTKLISEIIVGDAPIEPKIAIQFEEALGVDTSIWLGMESDYRVHRKREAELQ